MKIDRKKLYLRGATIDDAEEFGAVIDKAFQKNHQGFKGAAQSVPRSVESLEDVRLILLKEDNNQERILGACPIQQYPCHYGSSTLKSGGLSVVGIDPVYQRNGLGQLMLEDAEKHMYENGYDICLLFTGSPNFYRHKGWETAVEKYEYEINLSDIPKFEIQNKYDRVSINKKDLENISLLYESFNKRYPLTKVRDLNWWKKRFDRNNKLSEQIYCIYDQNKLVAYFWIHSSKSKKQGKNENNNISLIEYAIDISLNQDLSENIYKIILNHLKTKGDILKIKLSDNYPFVQFLKDYKLRDKCFFISSMMILLVDISKFIDKLKIFQEENILPKISKEFIANMEYKSLGLKIRDVLLSYHIQNDKIKIKINPIDKPEVIIPISRKNLGVMSLGNFIPSNLVESEMWNCDEKYLELLDNLFLNQKMFVYANDGF